MWAALKWRAAAQIIDEFVKAVTSRWPKAVLQFEDFNLEHAHPLLNRYRNHHLVFNDDIQVSRPASGGDAVFLVFWTAGTRGS